MLSKKAKEFTDIYRSIGGKYRSIIADDYSGDLNSARTDRYST